MIRAVLFDLDGVLTDTERLHWTAYRRVLLDFGVDMDIEEYRRWFIARGIGPEYTCKTYRLPVAPDELRALKAPVYRTLLEEGVRPMPGAREALARLAPSHRLALATNTARVEVDLILGQLGLASFLRPTITREDYVRAKPAPDAYLAAVAALGLAAAECAVVEDTERGAAAALAAGIPVVAVPNDLTFDNDFTGCACRLASLDELTAELLGRLA
ncbi:MAG: HAD family phosphatase [Deltaproteobacteria bacterium]|nr:MAG: HAD family phosphatase [Deltaproteobacteria bacterium]